MSWQNRIIGLEFVPAGDLKADERNWRVHPVGQRQAMREVLDSVGWASAVIARHDEDGKLVLIDGHLRADLDPGESIPVLITDLDDEESAIVMATHDPLSMMADVDTEALQALLDNMPDIGSLIEGQLNDLIGVPPWTPETDQQYVESVPAEDTGLEKTFRVICPADQSRDSRLAPKVGGQLRGNPRPVINILISRSYMDKDIIDLLKFFSRSIDIRLLIDCGAYTDFQAGKAPISVEAYIEWINQNLPLFRSIGELYGYFALDVIGDVKRTMENYEKMLTAGLTPIPILTRGIGGKDIDRMVQTAPYIALGGIFGTSTGGASSLRWLLDQLPPDYPAHWLAFTNPSFIRHYKPASFDSSNWCRAAKWGFINMYAGNLIWKGRILYGHSLNVEQRRIIRQRGFNPALLGDRQVWRTNNGLNLTSCIQNAMYLQYMRDLEEFGVKMFLGFGVRWGLEYSMLNQYMRDGAECIGLPTNRVLRNILETYERPEDVTQEATGIVCQHH